MMDIVSFFTGVIVGGSIGFVIGLWLFGGEA